MDCSCPVRKMQNRNKGITSKNCRYSVPRDIWQTLVPSAQTSQQGAHIRLSTLYHSQQICSLPSPLSPSLFTFLKKSIFCIIISIVFFLVGFFLGGRVCYFYCGHQACWKKVCPRLDATADAALLPSKCHCSFLDNTYTSLLIITGVKKTRRGFLGYYLRKEQVTIMFRDLLGGALSTTYLDFKSKLKCCKPLHSFSLFWQ